MKYIFLLVFMWLGIGFAKTVSHEVLEDETAWFLADLYYGKGNEFPKILNANNLKRAEEVVPGKQLKIVDPKYLPASPEFEMRKAKLWQRRQKALGLEKPEQVKGVFLPTEQIRKRDKTQTGEASPKQ